MGIVICHSHGGQVGKQSNEDDEFDTDGLVDDDHAGRQIDLQVQTKSDTVLDVCLHTLKDLSSSLDGQNNCAETRCQEHYVCRSLSRFRSTLHGDTTVSPLERRSVIDTLPPLSISLKIKTISGQLTISSHCSQVTTLLKHFHNLIFVLREDFSETIRTFNQVVLSCTGQTTAN